MKKYLKSFVVLTCLFALPAGSWYFLQTGLDWRRVKAKELVDKGSVFEAISLSESEKLLLQEKLKGKTTLLKLKPEQIAEEIELNRQFEDAFTFQWLDPHTAFATPLSSLQTADYDYMLIDTSLRVRQTYKGSDKKVLTRIVEDLALMIPHRKSIDIKMKTKAEQ